MSPTAKPVVPSDPAYIEELDPSRRAEKFEHEFEESSEVEPSAGDLEPPDQKPR